jgi:hypothetical protein
VNLVGGFDFKYHQHINSVAGAGVTKIVEINMTPFYLFISGRDRVEGDYVTDIYLTSKEQLLTAGNERLDIDCDEVDNGYLINQLAALGAHTAILKNLNLADDDNVTFLGYTKKAKNANSTTMIKPITNIILYYAGETDVKPSNEDKVFGKISYKLAGNLNSYTNVFADDIFLYYTRDAAAGTPLTSLGTSGSVANWVHGDGNRYVVKTVLDENGQASDLNDGAAGDYIYLLQTRDAADESSVVGSIPGSGSFVAIIISVVVFAGIVLWLCIASKKRHAKLNTEAKTDSEN